MSEVTYDTYFVSTMNHLYNRNNSYLIAMIDEVFKQGTDFQKAYCSGLEDFMYGSEADKSKHEHLKLDELCVPPIVADGYASEATAMEEFLKYNVWVSSVGDAV